MSARVVAVFVVLLAVLGGAALVYRNQDASRRPENAAELGKPLLKELKAADVAAIRIVEAKAALTVQRRDDGWTIAERADFPADVAKVREFVLKLIGLKVGQSEPVGEKDRARLNLDPSGTQVELNGADGKNLARLTVGKKYFKREVENPEKARADGRFVALPAEPGTVSIVSDPLTQASTKSADWIDRASFEVEKVKTLEVRPPSGAPWRIERTGDNADWKLANASKGEKLDIGRANAASYSLSLLELADVAPPELEKDDAATGLDQPTLVEAVTFDGLSYAVRVGKLEGENYFVRFSSSGTVAPSESDDRIKKLVARLPREKILSAHVLLIAKSKLEDTLKPRAEMLEKKEPAKK